MNKSKYLLDTCICVFLLRGKYGLDQKIREVGIDNCYISEITIAELLYGAVWSGSTRNVELTRLFCNNMNVLPIKDTFPEFAEQKAILRRQGLRIDDFDLLIGCCALHYDMVMVTENIKHLGRLSVRVENWVVR